MYDPSKITGNNHRDVESLHPKVAALANEFIKQANEYTKNLGVEVKIVSTLRTWDEQTAIYAQGRTKPGKIVTNAVAGKSMHNWGVAFDIGVFKNGIYNPSQYDYLFEKLAPIGKKLGLFWGGDFISIKDRPHYQYTGKYDNNTFLAKVTTTNLDELLGE